MQTYEKYLNKKFKTVGGRSVRIVCVDRKGFQNTLPILALVEDDCGNEIGVPYNFDLKLKGSIHFPAEECLDIRIGDNS